jgi:gas vesicle protein
MKTGKVVSGTLAGLAVGAIAGILLAPEKGSKTRKQIMDKTDDYVDVLKSKFDELRDSLTKKFESTKNDAEGLVDEGKDKYDDAIKDAENAATNFNYDSAAENKY